MPVNNTSSEIAAVVASQLNTAFSDNKIYRTPANVAGSSGVTLTFRDSDSVAPGAIIASDTTGTAGNFTASNTITTANIYVGNDSFDNPELFYNVAAVKVHYKLTFTCHNRVRVVVNEGSGSITITYQMRALLL